jgi:hypothetical protein
MFALFIFSNASCSKKIPVEKTVTGDSYRFLLGPQAAGDFDLIQNIKFDLKKMLDQFSLSVDKVESVKVETLTITIEDTTAALITYDIIDKASVDIVTATLPDKRLAFKDPVPHHGIIIIVPDIDRTVEVLDYAKANDVTYHLTGTLNKALDHQVKMRVDFQWHIMAHL